MMGSRVRVTQAAPIRLYIPNGFPWRLKHPAKCIAGLAPAAPAARAPSHARNHHGKLYVTPEQRKEERAEILQEGRARRHARQTYAQEGTLRPRGKDRQIARTASRQRNGGQGRGRQASRGKD